MASLGPVQADLAHLNQKENADLEALDKVFWEQRDHTDQEITELASRALKLYRPEIVLEIAANKPEVVKKKPWLLLKAAAGTGCLKLVNNLLNTGQPMPKEAEEVLPIVKHRGHSYVEQSLLCHKNGVSPNFAGKILSYHVENQKNNGLTKKIIEGRDTVNYTSLGYAFSTAFEKGNQEIVSSFLQKHPYLNKILQPLMGTRIQPTGSIEECMRLSLDSAKALIMSKGYTEEECDQIVRNMGQHEGPSVQKELLEFLIATKESGRRSQN